MDSTSTSIPTTTTTTTPRPDAPPPRPPAADEPSVPKCRRRGCTIKGPELHRCANQSCKAFIHFTCYQLLCMKNNIEGGDMNDHPCCTKKCHDKVKKGSSTDITLT